MAHDPSMSHPTLERMEAEFGLLVARRRAEGCSQGSPSWDAAMGHVDELALELHRIDQADLRRQLVPVGQASN
jgi:hypothetical protein